ncbi:MAG: hydratase [Hyphomicrobiaceae bacterium]|nr:hydratase [Hyphomicrobiaceae bacterium]
MGDNTIAPGKISAELMELLGTEKQVDPFSRRYPDFDLNAAYEIVAQVRDLRLARGEKPVGRKIGFTNRSIWAGYGISAPIWNYVFDRTVTFSAGQDSSLVLAGMPEPRIEPEVVLHLAATPVPGMTAVELGECIDWVAPGFEVVYSIFPGWEFTAADAAAAYGVHGALIVGKKLDVATARREAFSAISTFEVELRSNKGERRKGHARNVLGGPLEALKFLVEEIARYPICEPLVAGEFVTTGTLTEAMPAHPGETWSAQFEGIALAPLQLHFG